MKKGVIFLIKPRNGKSEKLSMALEKHTKCRVFQFFNYEESLLYRNLNPNLIISESKFELNEDDDILYYHLPSTIISSGTDELYESVKFLAEEIGELV